MLQVVEDFVRQKYYHHNIQLPICHIPNEPLAERERERERERESERERARKPSHENIGFPFFATVDRGLQLNAWRFIFVDMWSRSLFNDDKVIDLSLSLSIYIYIYVWTYVAHVHFLYIYIYIYIYIHTYTYICIRIYIYIYIYIHLQLYTSVQLYTYIQLYIHDLEPYTPDPVVKALHYPKVTPVLLRILATIVVAQVHLQIPDALEQGTTLGPKGPCSKALGYTITVL